MDRWITWLRWFSWLVVALMIIAMGYAGIRTLMLYSTITV